MVNCPKGCAKYKKTFLGTWEKEKVPIKLSSLDFKSLSKSGKTLFEYLYCPSCHSVFKKGYRVQSLHSAKKV